MVQSSLLGLSSGRATRPPLFLDSMAFIFPQVEMEVVPCSLCPAALIFGVVTLLLLLSVFTVYPHVAGRLNPLPGHPAAQPRTPPRWGPPHD